MTPKPIRKVKASRDYVCHVCGLGIDKGYSMYEAGTIHVHNNTDCLSKFKAQVEQNKGGGITNVASTER